MADYTQFFLNSNGGVVALECIEISHPSFTQTFKFVRNDTNGIIAAGSIYQYIPMSIKRNNVTNDLDQTLSITIADMDGLLIKEVMNAIKVVKRAKVVFKIFSSEDLTEPLITLQTLEITSFSKDSSGLVTFEAQAPALNSVKTGQTYTLENYPLLKGI